MRFISRRGLILLGLALPLATQTEAMAAIPLPLHEVPDRLKPLGVFKVVTPRIIGGGGNTVQVDLLFRPAINVDDPILRYWVPRWQAVADRHTVRCPPLDDQPAPTPNGQPLAPMVAGIQTSVTLQLTYPGTPPKPSNIGKGEQRADRLVARQPNPRIRTYQALVELTDPASCRRSTYGFPILFQDNYPP